MAVKRWTVSCATVRRWCLKLGQGYANALRRRKPPAEALIKINRGLEHPCRAIDQDGTVLDILVVQDRRDKTAARRFFRRLLKRAGAAPGW